MANQESEGSHPNTISWFLYQFLNLSQVSESEPTDWRRCWVSRRKNPATPWQVSRNDSPDLFPETQTMDSGNCTLEKAKSKHFKDFWQRVWVDSDTWILRESASSDWSTQLKHDQASYQKLRGILEGHPGPELPMCLAEAFFGTTLQFISFCPILPPSLPPVGIDCKNTSHWILQASPRFFLFVLWTVSSKPLLPTGFSRENNRRLTGGRRKQSLPHGLATGWVMTAILYWRP